jgi:two-component system, OmpR family, response regulator RegX3
MLNGQPNSEPDDAPRVLLVEDESPIADPFAEAPTPATSIVGELRLDTGARRAWLAGDEIKLTRKEFDLLARLAGEPGRVVSRETLMSDVWDENWFGSTKTLDVHIAALRRKLGDSPLAPRYVETVRGVGFRLAAPTAPVP